MNRSMMMVAMFLVCFPGFGHAQDAPPPTDPNAGAYNALSPGNQKIVDAIYESHLDATTQLPAGTQPLSKDGIAAMKTDTGWGNAYKSLYEQGLVTHRNLGQAVSSQNRNTNATGLGKAGVTVVTTATGGQTVVGKPNAKTTAGTGGQGQGKGQGVTSASGGGAGAGAALSAPSAGGRGASQGKVNSAK